jgi:alkylated DNA repair protein (DNA oxidative demethylase)
MTMTLIQSDLFGAPSATVPMIPTQAEIVLPAEEQALIAAIDATTPTPFRFQGWIGKRLTTSFGWSYDFDRGRMERAAPMPGFLLAVRERAAAFAGLAVDDLVQALLIRYDIGAGIGWHRDRPVFEHVVGVSLGAPATLRLRRRRETGFDRASVALAPRSAYHLAGPARHEWEHSIAPMTAPRWSITFRSLAAR